MPFRDIFKHGHRRSSSGESSSGKEKSSNEEPKSPPPADKPEFTFIRSDTVSFPVFPELFPLPQASLANISQHTQTIIHPPTGFLDPSSAANPPSRSPSPGGSQPRSRASSVSRLFHHTPQIHKRNRSSTSVNIPSNLPTAPVPTGSAADPLAAEAAWESRAAALATASSPIDPQPRPKSSHSAVAIKDSDDQVGEAIRLHECGDLAASTAMFGRLAEPSGFNNPLSQVMYGLALRHGWGIEKDEAAALRYLKLAAAGAAEIEKEALAAGLKKGGAAKGELVLAMYELGNSYRQGWGVERDPVAAKEFYETAANLGDADAMNEVAWCYLEGFGCKKDKKKAAQFYRRAEAKGSKTLGNSW